VVFVVDDGTDTIECTRYFEFRDGVRLQDPDDSMCVSLGDLVVVRGALQAHVSDFMPSMPFRELDHMPRDPAIAISYIECVGDQNYEVEHWKRCMRLHTEVYSPSTPSLISSVERRSGDRDRAGSSF
jgi:hypothetical protein